MSAGQLEAFYQLGSHSGQQHTGLCCLLADVKVGFGPLWFPPSAPELVSFPVQLLAVAAAAHPGGSVCCHRRHAAARPPRGGRQPQLPPLRSVCAHCRPGPRFPACPAALPRAVRGGAAACGGHCECSGAQQCGGRVLRSGAAHVGRGRAARRLAGAGDTLGLGVRSLDFRDSLDLAEVQVRLVGSPNSVQSAPFQSVLVLRHKLVRLLFIFSILIEE